MPMNTNSSASTAQNIAFFSALRAMSFWRYAAPSTPITMSMTIFARSTSPYGCITSSANEEMDASERRKPELATTTNMTSASDE